MAENKMKQGLYIVESINGNHDRCFLGVGELVNIYKENYKDRCVICGKMTNWMVEGEYVNPMDCDCMKKHFKLIKF